MFNALFGEQSTLQRDACISECGRYRWSLSRAWDADLLKPWVGFIMLNPSTADAEQDDPTIKRCIAFAKAWGFAGLAVRNLFALRATDPGKLFDAKQNGRDPVGSENDLAILDLVGACPLIIAAWGTNGPLLGRDEQVKRLLAKAQQEVMVEVKCLGITDGGHPKHPLYLPGDTVPIPFSLEARS